MRWWQVWVLAGTVLIYSVLGALSEYRLAEARAERDRLAEQLSRTARDHYRADALRDEVRRLKAQVRDLDGAPVRGPYPDGMSDERLGPWRPGTRQPSGGIGSPGVGLVAETADHNVKDKFVFTPPPIPGNETSAVGPLVPAVAPLVPAVALPPAGKTRTYTGMLLERTDSSGNPAFVIVTRDADYWLGRDPRRISLADLRALVGREVRVKSAGQVTLGTRRFLMAAEVTPAGRRNDRGD